MWTFLARRLLAIPPLLLVISCLTYLLMQASPSGADYFQKLEDNPTVPQDYVMDLRHSAGKVADVPPQERALELGAFEVGGRKYGFDASGALTRDGAPAEPRAEQTWLKRFEWEGERYTLTERGNLYRQVGAIRGYVVWLGKLMPFEFEGGFRFKTPDLGQSYHYKASVGSVLSERLLNTLLLSVVELMIAWCVAIPLGVWAGVRPNSIVDHVCGAVAYFGLSIPSVFLALLALLFAAATGWFPVGDMRDNVRWDTFTAWQKVTDVAWHVVLPASVAAMGILAGYMRQMRGQMVETMSADYVRTARAKGVSHRRVVFRHALRNAINPLVTMFGLSLASLLSGSFLVEVVLNWPGLARLVVDGITSYDEPLVMASILMATLMLVFGNLVADVLLAVVDPRIRLA
jgi:peptide/nickel transport system permease protein